MRQVLDISPGQVCSLRDEPLIRKNAQVQSSVVMALLRLMDRVACVEPVDGDVIIRIGKAGACLAGYRRLARMAVGIPCRGNDRIKLAPKRRKTQDRRKRITITPFEFIAAQFDGGIPFRTSGSAMNIFLEHRRLQWLRAARNPPEGVDPKART